MWRNLTATVFLLSILAHSGFVGFIHDWPKETFLGHTGDSPSPEEVPTATRSVSTFFPAQVRSALSVVCVLVHQTMKPLTLTQSRFCRQLSQTLHQPVWSLAGCNSFHLPVKLEQTLSESEKLLVEEPRPSPSTHRVQERPVMMVYHLSFPCGLHTRIFFWDARRQKNSEIAKVSREDQSVTFRQIFRPPAAHKKKITQKPLRGQVAISQGIITGEHSSVGQLLDLPNSQADLFFGSMSAG